MPLELLEIRCCGAPWIFVKHVKHARLIEGRAITKQGELKEGEGVSTKERLET